MLTLWHLSPYAIYHLMQTMRFLVLQNIRSVNGLTTTHKSSPTTTLSFFQLFFFSLLCHNFLWVIMRALHRHGFTIFFLESTAAHISRRSVCLNYGMKWLLVKCNQMGCTMACVFFKGLSLGKSFFDSS